MTSLPLESGSAAKPPRIPSTAPQILRPSDSSRYPSRNSRKRKRSNSEDGGRSWRAKDASGHLSYEEISIRPKEKTAEVPLNCIVPPNFTYPKTAYNGHVPSMPRYSEKSVLQDILVKVDDRHDSDAGTDGNAFIEAELRDFVIYRPHKASHRGKSTAEFPRANELVSLHDINENGVKYFYFDGVICYAGRQRYVQKVSFETLSIGGYEEPEQSTVGPYVWIQSTEGTAHGVWYRLSHPAAEYKRYHEPFLWMADLAKHLVDYLQTHVRVALADLRHRFYDWLQNLYPTNGSVRRWLDQYRDRDFRRIVAAHANFLYFQAIQVDQKHEKHPIWEEMHPRILRAIPEQVEQTTNMDMFATFVDELSSKRKTTVRKTTVTPYVYNCFKKFRWEKFLYSQPPSSSLNDKGQGKRPNKPIRINSLKQKLEVRIPLGQSLSGIKAQAEPATINIGDVVAITRDNDSAWKTDDAEYLGYVQSMSNTDKGQVLGLLWFYRPGDTTCLKMFYPYSQELFLSDHCNCGDPQVLASDVIRKPQVTFSEPESSSTEFFCRQRYVEGDGAWVTLQDSHLRCGCKTMNEDPAYSVGDTLLVASSSRRLEKILEPVVLLEHHPDGRDGNIKIIRLLRRRDYGCETADANELVLTDSCEIIPASYIIRRCSIRFFSEAEKKEQRIPSPYNCKGASDFFYITSQHLQASGSGFEFLQAPWPSFMRQGWDPTSTSPWRKLRGLDLFCGGGNFGRGLEEGGAIEIVSAVDWNVNAIHTYKANLHPQSQAQLFHGSVNHYLSLAMEGKGGGLVAQIGEIEIICAGNPCQGYSLANPNKGNETGLLNESMVASVLAFIDFYRPKYALMENVKGMALGDGEHNVLAQVVCCLVGMGYQVRTFCLDAWSFGCPQRRSRIIITIAAPGLTPLPEPAQTHSHPEGVTGGSLGKTANGLHTSSRTTSHTAFEFVSSAFATRDLPATDARTTCIPFPDHRMSRTLSVSGWVRISSIPRFPRGCSFVKAVKQGYMPQTQIDAFNWGNKIRSRHDSRSWQRVSRNSLMPTMMTEPRPDDGGGGDVLHWDDHRLLTIMEGRRAQAFPDYEVLIGSPLEQWKMMGNSVARYVVLALGVSLRTALLADTARQELSAVPGEANGMDSSWKTKRPASTASTGTTRNGWSAQDMLTKLTSAPRALASAISSTIREPLTSRAHHITRKPEHQSSEYTYPVSVCKTGVEHLDQDEISDPLHTSTTMAKSLYNAYAPEGYGLTDLQIPSA